MAQATETPLSSTQRETYKGIEGARRFIRDWTAVFDEWEVDLEEVHDAGGDTVVGIVTKIDMIDYLAKKSSEAPTIAAKARPVKKKKKNGVREKRA